MNRFDNELSSSTGTSEPSTNVDEVVDRILQVVPRTMRRIRTEMRTAGTGSLTVPQLRALLHVRRRPGSGLSPLADHLGMSLPAASGLVDRLVRADLIERSADPVERRRIQLRLTPSGAELVGRAHLLVRARLSADLAALSPTDLAQLASALDVLAGLSREERAYEP